MVRTLIRKLGLALLAATGETFGAGTAPSAGASASGRAQPGGSTGRPAPGRSSPADSQTFEREAGRMLKTGDGTVQAGAVLLIGMEDIRLTIGPAWSRIADRAQSVVEQTIRRHLGRHDVFTRRDQETYFLCFANLDREQAERLVQRIIDEIKSSLVRQLPDVHGIDVAHEMVALHASALNDGPGASGEPIAAAIDRIRKDAGLRQEHERRRLLEHAVVRYAPVWSVVKGGVLFFRCLAEDAGGGPLHRALTSPSEAGNDRHVTSEVDGMVFERAAADLQALLDDGGNAILIIPVAFDTLDRKRSREAYLSLCRKLPQEHRRFVMFELYGIPPRARGDRVIELLLSLKPNCRAIVLERAPDGLPVEALKAAVAFAASIDLEAFGKALDLRRLLATCARSKLGTLLYGVRTQSGVLRAAKAGVDFVGGDAIGRPLDKPRTAYPLQLLPASRHPPVEPAAAPAGS